MYYIKYNILPHNISCLCQKCGLSTRFTSTCVVLPMAPFVAPGASPKNSHPAVSWRWCPGRQGTATGNLWLKLWHKHKRKLGKDRCFCQFDVTVVLGNWSLNCLNPPLFQQSEAGSVCFWSQSVENRHAAVPKSFTLFWHVLAMLALRQMTTLGFAACDENPRTLSLLRATSWHLITHSRVSSPRSAGDYFIIT